MTDLVLVHRGKGTSVSLADIQSRLDARKEVAKTRSTVSTRKSRVEEAKRDFDVDPISTLFEIQRRAKNLLETFDESITLDSVPLSQQQKNALSDEYYQLEKLQDQITALATRYRALVYAHLDETVTPIPGRPVSQIPGKVEAEGPGPYYVFDRRGGNRKSPTLDTAGLREELPPEIVALVYKSVHQEAIPARDVPVFDEAEFVRLVIEGKIPLDLVEKYLTPGEWLTPAFYKTLVDGE